MSEHLGLSADEVLTTTRAVRKRLDLTRPVPREVLTECIDIAHQSPTGSNSQRWRWMIIDDPDKRRAIADIYRTNFAAAYQGAAPPPPGSQAERVNQSAQHLADHLHEVPVHVIPLLADRHRDLGVCGLHRLWIGVQQRSGDTVAELPVFELLFSIVRARGKLDRAPGQRHEIATDQQARRPKCVS